MNFTYLPVNFRKTALFEHKIELNIGFPIWTRLSIDATCLNSVLLLFVLCYQFTIVIDLRVHLYEKRIIINANATYF